VVGGSSEFLLSVKGEISRGCGELALLDSFEDGTTNTGVDISGDIDSAFCVFCLQERKHFELENYFFKKLSPIKITYGVAFVGLRRILSPSPPPLTWPLSRTLLSRLSRTP
jgi:hypothetical protein